jgi:hypothetical protein
MVNASALQYARARAQHACACQCMNLAPFCLRSGGLAPMFVGLAVLICFPLTFLLLAYLACTEPLYRKEKAVYLVSKRSERREVRRHGKDLARYRGCQPASSDKLGHAGVKWAPIARQVPSS